MQWQSYIEQSSQWPQVGKHILAQFDADSIIVYQAYRPSIADFAVEHQRFGGEFSFQRMSWVKPNFLWMMYRSGWATKEGQERILAVHLPRLLFDNLLQMAVPSSFDPSKFVEQSEWRAAVASSDVRLQWDPDHDPAGRPLTRRAIQLGLRGQTLRRYGELELLSIEDITSLVANQRQHSQGELAELRTPKEDVYVPSNIAIAKEIGLDLG